jgi:hypothetical protein
MADNSKVKPKRITKPLHQLDYKKLDAMCAIHCTGEECAAILGIDYDTLNRALKRDGKKGFAEYFAQKGSNGKMSLRRKQYDLAIAGNSTMLIWLGKQWLGQVDKTERDLKSSDGSMTPTRNIEDFYKDDE